MDKIFNKKMGIVVLSAILLLAVIVSPLPFATAEHKEGAAHGGGGGGPSGGGGGPDDGGTYITDCNYANPIQPTEVDPMPIIIDGDVRVKDGDTCLIDSTYESITITGDVIAGTNSMLTITTPPYSIGTITIEGDVKTNGGYMIAITGSPHLPGDVIILGSVQVTNTVNGITIAYANIGGNAQFSDNLEYYSITNSHIGGSVQVKNNSSTMGYDIFNNFSGNTIVKNLQCSGNDPAPVAADFPLNFVSGKAQGQCSELSQGAIP